MSYLNAQHDSTSPHRFSGYTILGLLLLVPALYDVMQCSHDLPFYAVASPLVLAGMAFSHQTTPGGRRAATRGSQVASALAGVGIALVLVLSWLVLKALHCLKF